jgi:cupin 2 domain-containing protein
MVQPSNIFDLPDSLPNEELFEPLVNYSDILIERIISTGQTTPIGEWYDQPRDEWIVLLQGEARLSYENRDSMELRSGDYLLIPAHQKHRVEYTSVNPPCIWLAVHATLR